MAKDGMGEEDLTQAELDAAAQLMDDTIREDLHETMVGRSPSEFLTAYRERHLAKFGKPFDWR